MVVSARHFHKENFMTSLIPSRARSALSPWLSNGPIASLRDEMDDLFSRFSFGLDENGVPSLLSPSLDLSETDSQIEVKMDAPGMKAEDLDIEVTGDLLRISGEHKEEKEEHGRKFHRMERRSGSFERTVRLPCDVSDQDVDAAYQDGVLTVTLAKSEEAKTRKIPVKG